MHKRSQSFVIPPPSPASSCAPYPTRMREWPTSTTYASAVNCSYTHQAQSALCYNGLKDNSCVLRPPRVLQRDGDAARLALGGQRCAVLAELATARSQRGGCRCTPSWLTTAPNLRLCSSYRTAGYHRPLLALIDMQL
jgi:hypothetical protein